MPAITLANFGVYLLHVAALTAIGVGLPRVSGLAAPRARLLHYRVVLIVALVLPLAVPLGPPPAAWQPSAATDGAARHASSLPGAPGQPAASSAVARLAANLAPWAGPAAVGLLVVGLITRLAWMGAGLRRLRVLRRGASRLEPRPAPVREAVALAAADADIRMSRAIGHPVNFGASHPTILLPVSLQHYPDEEQRAVTCHELIHVRRHDWLRTVGDELLRAIFWFHPAVWWLLDEIHLAREQVVDQEVVEITGNRRPYLEALVKLARPAAGPALRPVSSILGRAQLARRVAVLVKEVRMSRTRVVGGLLANTSALLAAAALAAYVLPLQAAPARLLSPRGLSIGRPAPSAPRPATTWQKPETLPRMSNADRKIVSRVEPVYPPEARAKGVKGAVIVEARVDTTGKVVDARILRSIPLLDQAALDAVRQWRFVRPSTESLAVCAVQFYGGGGAAPGALPRLSPDQAKVLSRVEPAYPPEAKTEGKPGVVIVEARIDTAGNVTDVKVLRSRGPVVDQAVVDAVRQWKFQAPAKESVAVVTVPFNPEGRK